MTEDEIFEAHVAESMPQWELLPLVLQLVLLQTIGRLQHCLLIVGETEEF